MLSARRVSEVPTKIKALTNLRNSILLMEINFYFHFPSKFYFIDPLFSKIFKTGQNFKLWTYTYKNITEFSLKSPKIKLFK